jgi:hypothetical protein
MLSAISWPPWRYSVFSDNRTTDLYCLCGVNIIPSPGINNVAIIRKNGIRASQIDIL